MELKLNSNCYVYQKFKTPHEKFLPGMISFVALEVGIALFKCFYGIKHNLIYLYNYTDDPCQDGNYVSWYDNDGKMSSGYGSGSTCHRPFTDGWYKVISPAGTDMPIGCVDRAHCNTKKPVWLNGKHFMECPSSD